MLIQLTAYKSTGKDTLYKNLDDVSSLGWNIYGPKNVNINISSNNTYRLAFADKLKVMVCELLELDKVDNPSTIHPSIKCTNKLNSKEWVGHLDLLKDISPNEINFNLQGKSIRTWLINYAKEKKELYGNMYFVNLVHDDVNTYLKEDKNIFITDTRYPYEVFPNAITIRLFRSDITVPKDESETSMDKYRCSYVLCKLDEDFNYLKQLQSQYEDYINYGSLDKYIK